MPDEGRARAETYLIDLPKDRVEYPPLPWTCPNATMLNVYFEVLKEPLLDRLPPEFCRTSPPYCRLTIFKNPESPIGAFHDAFLALGCRLNMMPAAWVAASITDNSKALAGGMFERGYPNALGRVEFEAAVDHARALVCDANGPLIELTMPLLQTIEPSRLAYDHADSFKTTAEGKTELMVTKPDMTIERAAICKNARIEYPTERSDTTWQILQCRNIVSAQVVQGTRTFAAGHPPQ